jgi:hypothetical protein
MAPESARMRSKEPSPPRWAEAVLRSLLRPADRESIPGDLLEEYRAARRPSLGALPANIWYLKHVLSMLWHLIRPCALVLVGTNVLRVILGVSGEWFASTPRSMTMLDLIARGLWYGSLVQAPGVALSDALIYLWAGYHGFQRTRLIKTGMLAAVGTSFVGFTILFTAIAVGTPSLLLAPFSNPFIVAILATLLLIALGYAALVGAIGAVGGKWTAPDAPPEARTSHQTSI